MDESQPNGFSLVKRPHGCDFSSKPPTKNSLDRLDEPGVSTAAPSSASAPALRVTHQARCGTIGSWGQSYSAGPLCEATGRGKHYSHPRTLKSTATQGGGTSPTPVRRYGPDRERMLIAWLMRSRSSTATLKSRVVCRFSAARGCRFRRCSTTWKGERHSTSSSISFRRSQSNRHSPLSIWLGISFWPVRVLLDENLPRSLVTELTGHEVSTVQAAGWSGTTNGELLRLAQGSFDVLLSMDRGLQHQQDQTSVERFSDLTRSASRGRCCPPGDMASRAARRRRGRRTIPTAVSSHGTTTLREYCDATTGARDDQL